VEDRTTKIRLLRVCIFSIADYACETWTLTNQLKNSYVNCYRRIIRIPWAERTTNITILQEFRIKGNYWLLNQIIAMKIKYSGHIKKTLMSIEDSGGWGDATKGKRPR